MYIPIATVSAVMATTEIDDHVPTLLPKVSSSTASSIYVEWMSSGLDEAQVTGFKVQFRRISSNYVRESRMLPSTDHQFGIDNLVADTYYKVCVSMFLNNSTPAVSECVDASTTNWHIPVSIGSSIGAVLALSIIVLIVLLSRCPTLVRPARTSAADSSKYDSMSSHYRDDRCDMSDTTTQCHDKDDDMFSQLSEGDSLTDSLASRGKSHPSHSSHYHHHHHQPLSLADRLCNGTRIANGTGRTARVPLGKCGRTFSLNERRQISGNQQYKARQARLANLHAAFHSIQSEPGLVPTRASPKNNEHDLQSSSKSPSSELGSGKKLHHSSLPAPSESKHVKNIGMSCTGCNSKPLGYRDTPRLLYKIDSASSTSEPTVIATASAKRRPPLKHIPKALHMSIDGDTLV